MTSLSPAEKLAALAPDERDRAKKQLVDTLGPRGVANLKYTWPFWARPNQLPPPGNWFAWLILAGRGWGKSRTGAEFIKEKVISGEARYPRLIARTSGDIRNTMVEGESGLLAVSPPDFRPRYTQTTGELHWPNGSVGLCYSAEEPDRLRGPQCDIFWCDEIGTWGSTQGRVNARLQKLAWDTHCFGVRLGERPHGVVTTTPTATPVIRDLLKRVDHDIVLTQGTSYDNRNNLADSYWSTVIAPYDGTIIGRQEIYAEVLDLTGEGFIDGQWIRQCTELDLFAEMSGEFLLSMPWDIGLDVARAAGGDLTVFACVRDGRKLEFLHRAQGQNTMSTCGQALTIIKHLKPRSLRIDDGGVGGGCTDRLFELQEEQQDNVPLRNCEILPLNFGSKAFDQRRFANLRAELWWELGEKIRNGQIELPYDLDLMAELAAPAMETTSNRRFILESKESLKRRGVDSPDAGDALALAAYDYENFPRACAW